MALPLAATWELALLCNYRCPYCFVPWDEPTTGVMHIGISPNDWTAFWERLYSRYGRFHLTIAGGEPFVYPGFVEMIQRVSQRHMLSVNTNLSWNPADLESKVSPENITISASFHPHYAELQSFIPKIARLRSLGYQAIATVVAYPPYFGKLPQFRAAFEQAGIPYSFQAFQGKIGSREYPRDYTENERSFLFGSTVMKMEAMSIPMQKKSPYGRLCAAGQSRFRVTADGKLFRCAPSVALDEKPLGDIRDANLELFTGPRPCPAQSCHCPEEFSYLLDLEIETVLQTETFPAVP